MTFLKTEPQPVGIAVAANNIEPATIARFREHAENAMNPGDMLAIAQGTTRGYYNKSRELNRCIRRLLQTGCDIIIQSDIDILTTRDLLDATRATVVPGVHFWVPCISHGRVRHSGKGSWNALTRGDWIKTGGFDERCSGWGFEDVDFHIRCEKIGFVRKSCEKYPVHANHPERQSWSREDKRVTRARNVEATKTPNDVNYLTHPGADDVNAFTDCAGSEIHLYEIR